MSPHRRLSPLGAAIQATTAAALPALASASSIRSRSKHRHTHLHKDHHASSSSDDSTEEHTHHEHTHSHAHSHSHTHDDTQDSIDELRRRDDSSATVVTQVVQTVSVVQVIDAQGSIVTLSTAYTPSATQAEADLSAAGTTADSSDSTQTGNTAVATAAAAATSSGSTSTAALTSGATALTSGAASVTAAGSAFANGTATAISVPLTTGPSTAATLTGNSTSTHLFGNSTSSTFHSLFANRTHSSSASSSYASSSSYLSSSSASSSGYSSSLYSSATGSSSAYGGEATGGADGAGGAAGSGAATGSGAGAAPTSTTTDDGTSSSTPTSVLVGSVIGGLAGLAVLLVIALYLLKMKKKKDQSSHRLLTDGDDSGAAGAARSIPSGPSGSGGPAPALSGLGLGMSEARTGFLAPFASALASGQKRMSRGRGLPALIAPPAADASTYPGSPTPSSAGSPDVNTRLIGGGLAAAAVAGSAAKNGNGSPTSPQSPFSPQSASSDSPTTERSFYRVSGRKLPSVLQHGGDGYDDPRQSVMSTNTINTSYTANTGHMSMYRDSRGFFGGAGGPATTPASRYALGTPMRPESGVPVLHNGPGKLVSPMRAPMSRQGSFIDDGASATGSARNLTPPAAPSSGAAAGYFDPVGRSLISQDGSRGSRGSVSRFTEDIL